MAEKKATYEQDFPLRYNKDKKQYEEGITGVSGTILEGQNRYAGPGKPSEGREARPPMSKKWIEK